MYTHLTRCLSTRKGTFNCTISSLGKYINYHNLLFLYHVISVSPTSHPIRGICSVYHTSGYHSNRPSKTYTKTELGAGLELSDVY